MRRRVLLVFGVSVIALAQACRDAPTADAHAGPLRVAHTLAALDPDPGGDTAEVWMPATAGARPWPLLLFSPGLGQSTSVYSSLASGIASHGYVVVAVPHPDSLPAEYPEMASAIAAGLVAALDDVVALHAGLLAHADLTRVGVLGHSMGGAAAALACRLDRRFKAGMDMDGTVFGSAVADGVPSPFLLFSADLGVSDLPQRASTPYDPAHDRGRLHEEMLFSRTPVAYWANVEGLRHMAFADDGHLSLLERAGQAVGYYATGGETRALATAYAVAFFDRFVRGAPGAYHQLALPRSPRVRVISHWRTPAAADSAIIQSHD